MTPLNLGHYLFLPERVRNLLNDLPSLRSAIADPFIEGQPSSAFSRARLSPREIFRVLGNDHYEHLAQLLVALDRCIAAGLSYPNLLRTRSWKTFSEGLAEVHVASHLHRLSFALANLDADKANDRVPDIIATRGNTRVAIEVYSPQRWDGIDN